MAKKEIKNNEDMEMENIPAEEETVDVETKQKFGSKIVGFGKKHGKKIVKGVVGTVAVAAVGLAGFVLGQKKAGGDEEDFDEDVDFEPVENDFDVEVDPE